MTDERAAGKCALCDGKAATLYFHEDSETPLCARCRNEVEGYGIHGLVWRRHDALRAENTELSARVSELTRLLAEAETAIQAYFEGEHHPLIEGVNRLIIEANDYSDAVIEWKVRAIKAECELEDRALQSGEGKEPSR